MAEKPSGPKDPLDVKQIHYLVRLMKQYDLTALDLKGGPVEISLRRKGPVAVSTLTGSLPQTIGPAAPIQPLYAPRAEPPPASPPPASKTIVIESPMVGTYYTSSAPITRRSSPMDRWSVPIRPSASSRR